MKRENTLTKVLAIAGTVLLWLPILFMVITSIIHLVGSGEFLFDYLVPAELFLMVLAGALLLLWAALRAKTLVKPVLWGVAAGAVFLGGGQLISMLTGLASGEREASGWPLTVVLGMVLLYDLLVLFLAIMGILLIVRLCRSVTTG